VYLLCLRLSLQSQENGVNLGTFMLHWLQSGNSCDFMSVYVMCMSCHVICMPFHLNSFNSFKFMSFISFHVIHMSFYVIHVIHVIHVNSCHSSQFMSIHSVHVNSCHSCHLSLEFPKIQQIGGEGGVKYAFLGLRRQLRHIMKFRSHSLFLLSFYAPKFCNSGFFKFFSTTVIRAILSYQYQPQQLSAKVPSVPLFFPIFCFIIQLYLAFSRPARAVVHKLLPRCPF
jgi:hypothetical protein